MVKRVLCPFCSYGCEFGIVLDDFGIKGVEYLKDTPNQGRLCPRGSAAARYLDHPMRLTVPYRSGPRDWQAILKDLRKALLDPASVAVAFDRNITVEEYEAVMGFCEKTGIEHVASAYFEPETLLDVFFDPRAPFSVDEIGPCEMILVLGDLFNQSPMISRHLINWKLRDRKNRLVVIDSLKTHTAYFASDFIRVKPGTEALLFQALCNEKIGGIDLNETTGVPGSAAGDFARSFKNCKNGLIMACLAFGHTYDPVLLVDGLKRFSASVGKKVVPFVEFKGFQGRGSFADVLDRAKKKGIKTLVSFGELFPFYYPQVARELGRAAIYAAVPLRSRKHTQLPFALNIEKTGSVVTTFGVRRNSGDIKPPSGAKDALEILGMLGYEPGKAPVYQAAELKVDVKASAKKVAESCAPLKKNKYRLFGEKNS
jgi:hypothetical protein